MNDSFLLSSPQSLFFRIVCLSPRQQISVLFCSIESGPRFSYHYTVVRRIETTVLRERTYFNTELSVTLELMDQLVVKPVRIFSVWFKIT